MFWRIKEAFARFMYGRNGVDRFTLGLTVAYFVLTLVRSIVWAASKSIAAEAIFNLLLLALFGYIIFRFLSKNIYARREEERKFLLWWSTVKNRLSVISKNSTDKAHKYLVCPHCKAIIRFPRKKGVHSASCPKCRGPLTVKI